MRRSGVQISKSSQQEPKHLFWVSVLLLSARISSMALQQNETITVQKWQIVTARQQVRRLSTVESLNWQRENNQKRSPRLHLSSSVCWFRYCFCSFSMKEHRRVNKDRWTKQVLIWFQRNICIYSASENTARGSNTKNDWTNKNNLSGSIWTCCCGDWGGRQLINLISNYCHTRKIMIFQTFTDLLLFSVSHHFNLNKYLVSGFGDVGLGQ